MFLSRPSSAGDQNSRLDDHLNPDYQRLSAVHTTTGGDTRSFRLSGLQPGTLYAVQVFPFADDVDGAASNTVYLQTSEDGQYYLFASGSLSAPFHTNCAVVCEIKNQLKCRKILEQIATLCSSRIIASGVGDPTTNTLRFLP